MKQTEIEEGGKLHWVLLLLSGVATANQLPPSRPELCILTHTNQLLFLRLFINKSLPRRSLSLLRWTDS